MGLRSAGLMAAGLATAGLLTGCSGSETGQPEISASATSPTSQEEKTAIYTYYTTNGVTSEKPNTAGIICAAHLFGGEAYQPLCDEPEYVLEMSDDKSSKLVGSVVLSVCYRDGADVKRMHVDMVEQTAFGHTFIHPKSYEDELALYDKRVDVAKEPNIKTTSGEPCRLVVAATKDAMDLASKDEYGGELAEIPSVE